MLGEDFSSLLERARGGDESAFAVLFRDLQPALIRYLRVLASGAAEDLAAETWFEVAKGLARFSGEERGFRAWAMTIARHRHVDWVRSWSRRPQEVASTEVYAEPGSGGLGADHLAMENLSLEAALRLVALLPASQAEVVVLRAVVGLSVEEVAEVVGRAPGAVRVSAHRGLRRLAQIVSGTQAAGEASDAPSAGAVTE